MKLQKKNFYSIDTKIPPLKKKISKFLTRIPSKKKPNIYKIKMQKSLHSASIIQTQIISYSHEAHKFQKG